MKKFIFVAAAVIVVAASSCTKSTVAPTTKKIDLSIGGRDTISNDAQAARIPSGKK